MARNTSRKPSTTRRKTTIRRKKKDSNKILPLAIFAIFLLALISLLIYLVFIFPNTLSNSIEQDLIKLYRPELTEKKEDSLILKLRSRPTLTTQQIIYDRIFNDYGIEIHFDKIATNSNRGINRLRFYKGNLHLKEAGEVYIYWNIEKERVNKIIEKTKKKEIKKEVVKPSKTQIRKESKLEIDKKTVITPVANKKTPIKKNTTTKTIVSKPTKPTHVSNTKKEPKRQPIKQNKPKPKIAIILDDAGYNYPSANSFYTLNIPLTFALIPGLENSSLHYQKIRSRGFDIIMHVPMEPIKGRKYVEEKAVLTTMDNTEITNLLAEFYKKHPEIIGMNNHMGSKAVQDKKIISAVMSFMKPKSLFWLDSKTTALSITKEVAIEKSIRYSERDIFLDNENTEEYAIKAIDKLIRIANIRGYSIGIGHVQSDALYRVLKRYQDKKESLPFEFVKLESLID